LKIEPFGRSAEGIFCGSLGERDLTGVSRSGLENAHETRIGSHSDAISCASVMELRYAPPAGDDELRAYLAIGFQSLVGTPIPEDAGFLEAWKARTLPFGRVRVMKADGAVAAGLVDLDLAMFLGGRSVPMAGVSFVATAPEHRGRNIAGAMMRAFVQEAHARGAPISGLFPAASALYRGAGYGLAGFYGTFRLPLAAVRARPGALSVRRATQADHAPIQAIYRARAMHANGMLDRSPWVWRRILEPARGGPAYVYVVEAEPGAPIEGYVSFTQVPVVGPQIGYEIQVLDLCGATGRAHQALLGFLGAHRSVVTNATMHVAPSDPLLALLEEQVRVGVETRFDWMLRLTNLPSAFAARGYPRGLRGALHLDVDDEVVRDNAGRWIVEIEGGEARARRGGDGLLRGHVRALATLYTGHLSAHDLARTSAVVADDETLAFAAEAFAGPAPFMVDMF
jgi:predicted acetyltransferase